MQTPEPQTQQNSQQTEHSSKKHCLFGKLRGVANICALGFPAQDWYNVK